MAMAGGKGGEGLGLLSLAPLPAALRLCERLYLRGGLRGGLLAGEFIIVHVALLSLSTD